VRAQVLRPLRPPGAAQVGGRGAQQARVLGEAEGDQRGIAQQPDVQREVVALQRVACRALRERERGAQARMARLEGGQQRRGVVPAEAERGDQLQFAGDAAAARAQVVAERVEPLEQGARLGEQQLALGGGRGACCGRAGAGPRAPPAPAAAASRRAG